MPFLDRFKKSRYQTRLLIKSFGKTWQLQKKKKSVQEKQRRILLWRTWFRHLSQILSTAYHSSEGRGWRWRPPAASWSNPLLFFVSQWTGVHQFYSLQARKISVGGSELGWWLTQSWRGLSPAGALQACVLGSLPAGTLGGQPSGHSPGEEEDQPADSSPGPLPANSSSSLPSSCTSWNLRTSADDFFLPRMKIKQKWFSSRTKSTRMPNLSSVGLDTVTRWEVYSHQWLWISCGCCVRSATVFAVEHGSGWGTEPSRRGLVLCGVLFRGEKKRFSRLFC